MSQKEVDKFPDNMAGNSETATAQRANGLKRRFLIRKTILRNASAYFVFRTLPIENIRLVHFPSPGNVNRLAGHVGGTAAQEEAGNVDHIFDVG